MAVALTFRPKKPKAIPNKGFPTGFLEVGSHRRTTSRGFSPFYSNFTPKLGVITRFLSLDKTPRCVPPPTPTLTLAQSCPTRALSSHAPLLLRLVLLRRCGHAALVLPCPPLPPPSTSRATAGLFLSRRQPPPPPPPRA